MTDPCKGCIESSDICHIKVRGIDSENCPCFNCLVKSMCGKMCDDYYDEMEKSWQK